MNTYMYADLILFILALAEHSSPRVADKMGDIFICHQMLHNALLSVCFSVLPQEYLR